VKSNYRHIIILLVIVYSVLINLSVLADNAFTFHVDRYQIIGENPLSPSQTDLVLRPFLGTLNDLSGLQQASTALQNALQDAGYGFYSVSLPPQALQSGIVQLTVTPIKINNISVNQGFIRDIFFSEENIRASIPSLIEEHSPNIYHMARELELANKNPAKDANIQFSKSEKVGYIDANILVSSKPVDNFFAWLNNTGTQYTGDYRLGIGYKNNNLFDRDHEISLSFTTSPDFPKDVQQYGISYRIPLYKLLAVWQLYAYYSDIDSGVVAGGFDVSGSGTFIGSKYEWHLPKLAATKSYSHQLTLGFDDKLFDNDVFFTDTPFGHDVRSTPLSINYRGLWKELRRSFGFYLEWDKNLGWGSLNDDKTYAVNRYNAKSDWQLFRFGGNFQGLKERWLFKGRFDAQYSSHALVSGEQFGMGGITGGVRGFVERELIGDKGIRGSLEVWLPPVWENQIRLLGFIDGGYVKRNDVLPGELESESIASMGVGMAWQFKEKTELSVYLSQAINGNDSNSVEDSTDKGDYKLQFHLFIHF